MAEKKSTKTTTNKETKKNVATKKVTKKELEDELTNKAPTKKKTSSKVTKKDDEKKSAASKETAKKATKKPTSTKSTSTKTTSAKPTNTKTTRTKTTAAETISAKSVGTKRATTKSNSAKSTTKKTTTRKKTSKKVNDEAENSIEITDESEVNQKNIEDTMPSRRKLIEDIEEVIANKRKFVEDVKETVANKRTTIEKIDEAIANKMEINESLSSKTEVKENASAKKTRNDDEDYESNIIFQEYVKPEKENIRRVKSKSKSLQLKTKEQIQKIVGEQLKENKKVSKDTTNKIYKKTFQNIGIAVLVMLYLNFIILGFKNVETDVFITDLKVFGIGLIILSIIFFENAYKKDSGALALNGIEMLLLGLATMSFIYITIVIPNKFTYIVSFLIYVYAIYYVAKSIISHVKMKKKYFVNEMKEIIKK